MPNVDASGAYGVAVCDKKKKKKNPADERRAPILDKNEAKVNCMVAYV